MEVSAYAKACNKNCQWQVLCINKLYIQFSWCATFLHISSTFFDVQIDWFDIILSQIEK